MLNQSLEILSGCYHYAFDAHYSTWNTPIYKIKDRCVVHARSRRYQRAQNYAGFASIHYIMIAVSQHSTASTGRLHGNGIRLSGAHLVIWDALVMGLADPDVPD